MNAATYPRYAEAWTLNPRAGGHIVTADPAELRAARTAAHRSWVRTPYYGWRYGEAGRLFSLSDSAWLATLRMLTPAEARHQIRWLGRVLAARGMPTWLLETHLAELRSELAAATPGRADGYSVLEHCEHELRDARLAHLSAEAFAAAGEAFAARAGDDYRVKGVGLLLAAAVADERAGITNAVASVESWLCRPEQAAVVGPTLVRETIAQARAAV